MERSPGKLVNERLEDWFKRTTVAPSNKVSGPACSRMFHVYVLLSQKTGRHYVGSTDNVDRRLAQHNAGYSASTRHGVPWLLVHVESFSSRAEAMNRERFYKTGKGREELAAMLG